MKAVAVLMILLGTTAIAAAQRPAPDTWCREQPVDRGGSTVQICQAYTRAQCLASRVSPTERCYLNPRYDPRFKGRY